MWQSVSPRTQVSLFPGTEPRLWLDLVPEVPVVGSAQDDQVFGCLVAAARGDAPCRMRHAMKEQEIGQHCCQTGESLSDADLSLLKQALGLDEEAWQSSKAKVRPEPE